MRSRESASESWLAVTAAEFWPADVTSALPCLCTASSRRCELSRSCCTPLSCRCASNSLASRFASLTADVEGTPPCRAAAMRQNRLVSAALPTAEMNAAASTANEQETPVSLARMVASCTRGGGGGCGDGGDGGRHGEGGCCGEGGGGGGGDGGGIKQSKLPFRCCHEDSECSQNSQPEPSATRERANGLSVAGKCTHAVGLGREWSVSRVHTPPAHATRTRHAHATRTPYTHHTPQTFRTDTPHLPVGHAALVWSVERIPALPLV